MFKILTDRYRDLLILQSRRQASQGSFIAISTCHPPIWSGLPLQSLLVQGPVGEPVQVDSEEGQSGWPAGDWRQTGIIWKSRRRDKNLHVCIAWYSLLFTTSLRINNYLLVEDDQISPRKKLIRSILMGLLWKPFQQENDKESRVNWDLGKGSRYYLGRRLGEIEIKVKPGLEKGRGWVKQKKHSSDCKSAMKGKREKCAWKSTYSDFFLQFLVLLSLFFKLPCYDSLLW